MTNKRRYVRCICTMFYFTNKTFQIAIISLTPCQAPCASTPLPWGNRRSEGSVFILVPHVYEPVSSHITLFWAF